MDQQPIEDLIQKAVCVPKAGLPAAKQVYPRGRELETWNLELKDNDLDSEKL